MAELANVTPLVQPESEPAPHGTPDVYREYIHEMAGLAALQAQLAMKYAEIGDDTGLEYATRHWVAYTKAVLNTLGDLKVMNKVKEVGHANGL